MRQLLPVALLTVLLPLAACTSKSERIMPPPEEEATTDVESSPAAAPPPAAAVPADSGIPSGVLGFDLPDGWEQVQPSSSMRMAQAKVPGPDGPGELAVFYFGPGQGGGVEANLNRWIGKMEQARGTESRRERFEVGELTVTWVEVAGTLKGGTMGGPANAQPEWMLLAAVVEGPGGPWFFKTTGPEGTLSAQRDAFLDMLESVRLTP